MSSCNVTYYTIFYELKNIVTTHNVSTNLNNFFIKLPQSFPSKYSIHKIIKNNT